MPRTAWLAPGQSGDCRPELQERLNLRHSQPPRLPLARGHLVGHALHFQLHGFRSTRIEQFRGPMEPRDRREVPTHGGRLLARLLAVEDEPRDRLRGSGQRISSRRAQYPAKMTHRTATL